MTKDQALVKYASEHIAKADGHYFRFMAILRRFLMDTLRILHMRQIKLANILPK